MCWEYGAAGHLLRGCPMFRGWCRRVRGAPATEGTAIIPGRPCGENATRPDVPVSRTAVAPRAKKVLSVVTNRSGLRPQNDHHRGPE